ncbi:MAG: hypothetical protein K9G83_06335 [Hyphomonadaceae bacterium]|jgi:hypothetical protein|nr:hypothetical protein [Hyphomonadaceae bacterium]
MKRFIAAALACAALAGPARAEPETKTQLAAVDGRNLETMRLRDGSTYATWVIDKQNALYRDDTGITTS